MKKAINFKKINYFYFIIGLVLLTIIFFQLNNNFQSNKASIGGSFKLVNQDNITFSNSDFKSKYLLIFFGFTNCYMVCPTGLDNMTKALDQLDEKELDKLTPVFITVDPKRDSPEVIKDYLSSFHNKFVGLTGSKLKLDEVKNNYGVFSQEAKSEDPNDYQVDHSAYIYLVKKNGDYVAHSFYNEPTEKIVNFLKTNLN
ncbi:MAG: SCO family protein [Rickettsiales bacterium]|nr:SCO family protein [Rickettsiales bacterium]